MVRRRVVISETYPLYIQTRDSIKNVLESALRRHGYWRTDRGPVRWGFGVRAWRIPGPQRLYQVREIIVGTADPAIAKALAAMTADDLVEPNAVPGAGIDFRAARIVTESPWLPTPAAEFRTVSPIRVLAGRHQTILELGPQFDEAVNRTMATRFNRRFQLRVQPDSAYVRRRNGKIVARMAIKRQTDGRVTVYPGLVFPFVLAGPPEDLAVAWYSGLGGSTGMGFGCIDLAW